MIEALVLLGLFAVGGLLALVVFGGLWLTVKDIDQSRHPAVRMLGSLLLRLGLVLGVFYLLVDYGRWQHVAAAALGFVLLKFFVILGVKRRPADKELDA